MVDCNKRQREKHDGTLLYRCIHPESEVKGEIVPDAVCAACPLVKARIKPCKEKQKEVIMKRANIMKAAQNQERVTSQPQTRLAPDWPECPYRYSGEKGTMCAITKLEVTKEICKRCDAETRRQTATFGQKVKNYFGAIRRWVASGRPRRTPEEIESLYENHCKQCERYDQEKHACKSCGCSVSKDSEPLGNKLAMATEHCPLGRF